MESIAELKDRIHLLDVFSGFKRLLYIKYNKFNLISHNCILKNFINT